jgi:hypothetical protein
LIQMVFIPCARRGVLKAQKITFLSRQGLCDILILFEGDLDNVYEISHP